MKKVLLACVLFGSVPMAYAEFKLGIENIPEELVRECKSCSIALVTNQTGKDQLGKKNIQVFHERGIAIQTLFAPEHGIEGLVEAGQIVKDSKDQHLHIPVVSLYGGHDRGKVIDASLLKDIDIIFFDIQDSGMRHYTYISTLYQVLESAAAHGKKIVVFDRPNPLGSVMEGPLVEPTHISFVSIAEIPLRHGLTMGELAEYFNTYVLKKRAALTVVPMKHYERTALFSCMKAPLSPNIATPPSCFGYSFLGLLGEIKPFYVGVGTEHAFQLITLPESLQIPDSLWQTLALQLKSHGIQTKAHRVFSEKKNQFFNGLKIEINDINQVNAFSALLLVISSIKKAGIEVEFSKLFDKCAGSPKVRAYLAGTITHLQFSKEINEQLQQFFPKAQSVLKYLPKPEMHFI